jgi:hypothetical protein
MAALLLRTRLAYNALEAWFSFNVSSVSMACDVREWQGNSINQGHSATKPKPNKCHHDSTKEPKHELKVYETDDSCLRAFVLS